MTSKHEKKPIAKKKPSKIKEIQAPTDWPAIRHAYVTGTMSTAELAEIYGQTHGAVHTQCTRNGWTVERAKLQKEASDLALKIFTERRNKSIERLANQAAQLTEGLFAHISFIINGAVVKDEAGRTIGTTLSPKDASQLAAAISNDLKAARLNLGISTDNQAKTDSPPAAPESPLNDLEPAEASRQYQKLMEG